jgi:hypothetical protein
MTHVELLVLLVQSLHSATAALAASWEILVMRTGSPVGLVPGTVEEALVLFRMRMVLSGCLFARTLARATTVARTALVETTRRRR